LPEEFFGSESRRRSLRSETIRVHEGIRLAATAALAGMPPSDARTSQTRAR